MTNVVVNLASIAGSAKPGDRIRFRVPSPRTSIDGRTVMTNAWDEYPAEKQVTVSLEPGRTEFQVVSGWPTKPIEIMVPVSGTHNLASLLEANELFSEGAQEKFASMISQVRDQALRAAEDAGKAQDAASKSASSAAGSATAASEAQRVIDGYRQTVTDLSKQTLDAKTAVDGAVRAVEGLRDQAGVSASSAKSDADRAASSASSADSAAKRSADSATAAGVSAKQSSDSAAASLREADRSKAEATNAAKSAALAAETAASGIPDASADSKGKVRLAGDLGGTADAPTVPGLANKADKKHTHTAGDIPDLAVMMAQRLPTQVVSTLPSSPQADTIYFVTG